VGVFALLFQPNSQVPRGFQVTNHSLDSAIQEFVFARELFAVAERALRQTNASGVAIALKEDMGFICRATAGHTVPSLEVRLSAEDGITGACIRSGQTEICLDAANDGRVNAAACEQLGIAAVIVVPIVSGGATVGVLEALSREPYAFGPAEQVVLEKLAGEIPVQAPADRSVDVKPPTEIQQKGTKADQRFSSIISLNLDVDVTPESLPPPEIETNISNAASEVLVPADISPGAKIIFVPLLVFAVVAAAIGIAYMSSPLTRRRGRAPEPTSSQVTSPTISAEVPSSVDPSVTQGATPAPVSETKPQEPEAIRPKNTTGVAELQAAAREGDPSSQFQLATALADGSGIAKDPVAAYVWYIVANSSGQQDPSGKLALLSQSLTARQIAEVRIKLAEMFWKGVGVEQDRMAAYTWLVLAEAAGSPQATHEQHALAKEMTSSQIHAAKQRAEAWLAEHRRPTTERSARVSAP
jgi:putative methionine-R-sulfoxide reductase with GAF domain